MSNELSFLTESTERRVLEHLDTRCPGENIMTLEQMAQLEEHEALVAARNDDVEAVAKSITDVAQIFKELAVLVIDQGTVLDRYAAPEPCVPLANSLNTQDRLQYGECREPDTGCNETTCSSQ